MDLNKPILFAIDDSKLSREMYTILFRDNYEVTTFRDSQELLKVMEEIKPAVLICDLCMPWGDGYTLIDNIQKRDMSIPIIVATAMEGKAHQVLCDALGCKYWSKREKTSVLKELVECLTNHCKA